MARAYKRKVDARGYKNNNKENLEKAIEACKNGMSIRSAIEKFNLKPGARGTIHNRLKGLHNKTPGGQTVFNPDEEKSFVTHLMTLAEWGFPFTEMDVRYMVKICLDRLGKTIPIFDKNMPGRDWYQSFLSRHSDTISSRICQNIKTSRAKVSPSDIDRYISNLKGVVEGVSASNIINYDETNLTDNPGRSKCVFKRGTKYPERVMNESKASISLMFAGTADGQLLHPYVVYRAENLWSSWIQGGPKGTHYNRSKTGWFDAVCFEDWFFSTILPYCKKLSGKKVLLGDNLSSHISAVVIKACTKYNIAFVCLPPNSTHLCQPLDVTFFGPMKKQWRNLLLEWKSQKQSTVTLPKEKFPGLLKQLMKKLQENQKENLISGFKKCGIVPVSAEAIKSRLPSQDSNASTDDLNASTVSQTVSSVVTDMLNEMRYGNKTVDKGPKRKRRRVDVAPGKSITYEDISGESCSSRGNHDEESERTTADDNGRQDLTRAGREEPIRECSSSGTNNDSGSDESVEDMERQIGEQMIPIRKEQVNKGDWILAEFKARKSTVYYAGNIVSVLDEEEGDGDFIVNFLRRNVAKKFYWPEQKDASAIDINQVVMFLPIPVSMINGSRVDMQFHTNFHDYEGKIR